MVTEGSVLVAGDSILGAAPDVAPDGFAHPVYHAGFALSIPLPAQVTRMSMRYRLTCLTPLLVGDGRKLSPIDYMVWKDQVNVLDQWRIFRLLAKGPRLDGYLAQLKRADKLDFASWGGFAQNFAGRRIPFESPAYSAYWNRASGESLHIPTFANGASGPYLPGTAIKGALRTGMVAANWKTGVLNDIVARMQGDRMPRRPAEVPEEQALGNSGVSRMRLVSVADSAPVNQRVVQGLLVARFHSAAARRLLLARLEAEPARSGGRDASGRQHSDLRRDGPPRLCIRGRLAGKDFLHAAGDSPRGALAGILRPRPHF